MESRRIAPYGLLVIGLCLCIGGGFYVWQWWTRPAVVQHDNLKYIQLLRTACSSQRADQLDGVERAVVMRRESGDMTEAEWKEFEKIFEIARRGDWRMADQQAYRLELGQLNRHRPE